MPHLRLILSETAGWFGTVVILLAYAANATGFVTSTAALYLIANIAGGLGLGINAFAKQMHSLVALEAVWISIGIYGLIKTLNA